jgi:DNA-directed RNA polymerase subunit beta
VFFDHDGGKTHSSGKYLFSARIIPYRGSWIDFEFDAKDSLYVRIDRKRKLPVTTLLMALDDAQTEISKREAKENGVTFDASTAKGMNREDLLNYFYTCQEYVSSMNAWKYDYVSEKWKGVKASHDIINADTGKVAIAAETKVTHRLAKKLEDEGLKHILTLSEDLVGKFLARGIIDNSGEVYAEAGDELSLVLLEKLLKNGINSFFVLDIDHTNVGPYLRNTLKADKNNTREEALMDIYRVMRPGEPPTLEGSEQLFTSLFFDLERYDLSSVGRVKTNSRLDLDLPVTMRILTREDFLGVTKALLDLKDGRGQIDDIDHLGNRRVRSVGELLENQYRTGLTRVERVIKERMSSLDLEGAVPNDLINAKPAASAVREFFASSQLSQFMDQNNPLAEITHKRRLSALGPGGLTRERAGFEVRDVHTTHYGRICPIETPEGPNIGLINSLATYARANQYGFIETPYRKVLNGLVSAEVIYLSAMDEGKYTIAQANAELAKDGRITSEFVSARKAGEFIIAPALEVELMDISPKQLVSVAASLIPFLENDDANRALMGSNMQRQAVPLLKAQAPLIGTGMEGTVARDSGVTVIAKHMGIVDQVDANRIVVRVTAGEDGIAGVDIYNLLKFQRSNQSTCINQKPLVKVGDIVQVGDIIADGPSTDNGELALGRNVLVGFMSWNGYNFEDSIIISERIVKDDVFTSIHIEEFEIMARDTKLGNEEITRDIPNVGEEALKNLDEAGIISIGAEVKPGDILVGKVTPKGESPVTPEEKLLRAIFGEKASDVRDSSLRVPPGVGGTIVEVRVFSRRGLDKDERSLAIEKSEIDRLAKDRDDEKLILERNFYAGLHKLLMGGIISKAPTGVNVQLGLEVTQDFLSSITKGQWRQVIVEDDNVVRQIESLKQQVDGAIASLMQRFEDKVEKLRRGDELPPGVLKMVKVFVAVKRKLQPGDKMAGRHGNKGVVSCIVPIEDMPYLEDGTPLDIVLNPLGIPSRMNVGQILETHLGWASMNLGKKIGKLIADCNKNGFELEDLKKDLNALYVDKNIQQAMVPFGKEETMELAGNLIAGIPMASPVFDGAKEEDITNFLSLAGVDTSGQERLYDGRTGEPFSRKVTVGCIYILKLHHLVDEKIHARSVGPYSLVTQQPLGGKAQFGGQRFGEMEVWALEAYGSAYTLQEMLTVKSDDVAGRTKVYEAIVRGDDNLEAGIPESFNVLVKELKSLGLNVEFNQRTIS